MSDQPDLFGTVTPCQARSATPCWGGADSLCGCAYVEGHVGKHRCSACGLEFLAHEPWPPSPPTGPEAEEFAPEEGQPGAYIEWRNSEVGRKSLQWMARLALERKQAGAVRVSINWLSDELRTRRLVRHCNTWRPWMATDLISMFPTLVAVIQRKSRAKPEPDPLY